MSAPFDPRQLRQDVLTRQLQGLVGGAKTIRVGVQLVATAGVAAGGQGTVTLTHDLGEVPAGALALVVPGGALVSSVPIECAIGWTDTTVAFTWRNNAGGPLAAATMCVAFAVWL